MDFYSFQASRPIQLSITDNPFTFATVRSLFNSSGDLLAFDDSSTPVKAGSASTSDSNIGTFVLPSAGTYFVSVGNAGASIPNYPDTSSCTGFGGLTSFWIRLRKQVANSVSDHHQRGRSRQFENGPFAPLSLKVTNPFRSVVVPKPYNESFSPGCRMPM